MYLAPPAHELVPGGWADSSHAHHHVYPCRILRRNHAHTGSSPRLKKEMVHPRWGNSSPLDREWWSGNNAVFQQHVARCERGSVPLEFLYMVSSPTGCRLRIFSIPPDSMIQTHINGDPDYQLSVTKRNASCNGSQHVQIDLYVLLGVGEGELPEVGLMDGNWPGTPQS